MIRKRNVTCPRCQPDTKGTYWEETYDPDSDKWVWACCNCLHQQPIRKRVSRRQCALDRIFNELEEAPL